MATSKTSEKSNSKCALVLSGGGARGAYQVGVLKGLAEILQAEKIKKPFQIISGVSAGAINAAKLASAPEDFSTAVEKLVYFWSNIKSDQVFNVNMFSISSLSGLLKGGKKYNAFLDTKPLEGLLTENINFKQIAKNLEDKKFESLIITANNYNQNCAVSFIQSSKTLTKKELEWNDSRRIAQETILSKEHVLASSAIPLLFPPVEIKGTSYGDGCVRNNTPCSPSLRLGANKLFVIGVRPLQTLEKSNAELILNKKSKASANDNEPASIIRIVNTLLNAVMLDSVEQDVQRILRINELVDLSAKKSQLKKIPAICISPSVSIGELSRHFAHHLSRLLRTTVNSFGSLDDANEIISYLMFNPEFCTKLIDIGYHDALVSRESILSFFNEDED